MLANRTDAAGALDCPSHLGRWPELPLDVLCSIAGRLPRTDRDSCDTASPAYPSVLRLVCRDWCAMLDTSITELKFGEDWPNLARVVLRFPFLTMLDFSSCSLSWAVSTEGVLSETQQTSGPPSSPAVSRFGDVGPKTGGVRESRLGQSGVQSDPVQAVLAALQPLTQLSHLEVLKVGYVLLKVLQQSSTGGCEREREYGFSKESPPYSPVSRLLIRLQASTRGDTSGNMDMMDGIDYGVGHANAVPSSPMPSPLSHANSMSDTRMVDQDAPMQSPSRMGGYNGVGGSPAMGGYNGVAAGPPSAVSTPRGSRLRVATFGESACRSPASITASRAIFSSPTKTPRAPAPKLSPLDQFTQLLEKLTHLKEFHVVIQATDNLAVYKLSPAPKAADVLTQHARTAVHPASNSNGPRAMGLSMPMTLFNNSPFNNSRFMGNTVNSFATAAGHAATANSVAQQVAVAPTVTAPAAVWGEGSALQCQGVCADGVSGGVAGLCHPLNAAFFSSPGSYTASPSTPSRWLSVDPGLIPSPASSLSTPLISPLPTPSITSTDTSLSHTPVRHAVFPQPTPPPSSPTTPPPSTTTHLRQNSPHLFSFSPLSSPSSPMRPLPEAGPWVQLGRRLQLPASFGSLQLSFLFLRSQNLQILPASIGGLTTVQELCLPANGLANLPYTMSRLQQLKALDLSDNRLRSSGLLLALSGLSPLQHLNLHRNRLLDTSFLQNLTQLHYLDLGSNKLKTLTHLANMSCLHTLDLSNNHLSVLPDEVSTLVALDYLDVRRNRLSMLPASLGALTGLTYVNASHNYIRSVDSSMLARLGRLQTLNLADNCLRDIPDTIGNCTGLGHLNLSCNQLDSLPASVSALTQLSSLVLNSNEVEELVLDNLPLLCNIEACDNYLMRVTLLRLPCLANLKLSGNYLGQLQLGPFPQLRYLHLSANHLETVELSGLPSLTVLDLSHNLLTDVPTGVSKLTALQLLFLTANRLSHLPSTLADLSQLTALHLDKNKLVELCWSGGPALLDLDISKNRLQRVSVSNCPVLHTLSLARNELEAEGLILADLPDMQILDLAKNKLGQMPTCVTGLSSLRKLDLSHNQLPLLPDALSILTSLAELTLKDNHLLELPDVLAALQGLTLLDVASNPIISTSPQLNRLTNLKQLYMRHISGHPLWTMDPPSPAAAAAAFSPSSPGPMSTGSSVSGGDMPPADIGDDGPSQPALPLPPMEGIDGAVALPADITQTVLADITTINVAASRNNISNVTAAASDNPVTDPQEDDMLDRLLVMNTDSAGDSEMYDGSGERGQGENSTSGGRGCVVGASEGMVRSDVDGGMKGMGPSLCFPVLSAVCCLPPIKSGSRDSLAAHSTQPSQVMSACAASVSGLSFLNPNGGASAGQNAGMKNKMRASMSDVASTSQRDNDATDQGCQNCGACPDCLGRMLAMAKSWTPWDSHHVTSLSTAPSLELANSALASGCELARTGSTPSSFASHSRDRSHSADSALADSALPSTSDSCTLTRTLSLESTCNTACTASLTAPASQLTPSDQLPTNGGSFQGSQGSFPAAFREASEKQPRAAVRSAAIDIRHHGRESSGALPPLLQARSPAVGATGGWDMQQWGDTSVWLLLLQLFNLGCHEVPMPLPHALVSLEISNPACKVKVDRDVGVLIARVLAKLTRSAAQFMRSLERNSTATSTAAGGDLSTAAGGDSFVHTHDFAMRLKTGYAVLLRLVRRHYGLKLEALDLNAE